MAHDNFSSLFGGTASAPGPALPRGASNASEEAVAVADSNGRGRGPIDEPTRGSSTTVVINGSASERGEAVAGVEDAGSDVDLFGGFSDTPTDTASTSCAPPAPSAQQRPPLPTGEAASKPGTESIQYLKKFGSNLGSIALRPLREMQLAEKLHTMNVEMEEAQQQREVEQWRRRLEEKDRERLELAKRSEQLARKLRAEQEEEACELTRAEADMACQRVGRRYDALVKFTRSCPNGTYEEFVEFLLMGGGRRESDAGEGDYDTLLFENFYDEGSEHRRLWNDNLMLGLPEGATTDQGRAFVPAAGSGGHSGQAAGSADPWHFLPSEGNGSGQQRTRTHSEDERLTNFGRTLRDRTTSEGERIKKQIAQVDRDKIKQGLGSAVSAISNVSSLALKPLRELQLAEKLNAINLDMEDEEARKEIDQYNRMQEEKRDLEEMMRIKKEAEESCLNATKDHLLSFVRDHPNATYHEWIEELHPENAHDGTLLEGMGKTIDHRFFVEESDHRRLWNENLQTFLDASSGEGRSFVHARARQMDERGEMVVADDILSGSVVHDTPPSIDEKPADSVKSIDSDLIAFD